MPRLEWMQTARADLLSIVEYIANNNPEAAQCLKEAIETKAGNLPDHPRLYRQGRVAGTREMVIHANYVLVYREGPEAITILS